MSNGERGGFVLAAAVVMLAILAGAPTWAGGPPSELGQYRFYASVSLGYSHPEENIGLLRGASGGGMFAMAFGHRLGGVFVGEAELGASGRDHEAPGAGLPDDPTLSISWLSYTVAARFNIGRFEPFVGVGVGSGQADLEVVSGPFMPPELQIAEDRGILYQYRAGFEAALRPKHRIGLELRRTDFEADLGDFTGGETEIGFSAALLTYHYTFGHRKPPPEDTEH